MNFLVIEGLDGAGKSTQVNKIKDYLVNVGIEFNYLHFPQTDSGLFGDLVARFLRGELGDIKNVDPYLVALIYAGDRKDAADLIESWLKKKQFVLVDRYVYSNIAFQCAKLNDPDSRLKLRDWILSLEYDYYKIPKPDKSIFLDVPFTFTQKSLMKSRTGEDRDYLQGGTDIHEADLSFQRTVRDIYHWQINLSNDFELIQCGDEQGNMKSPAEIFELIRPKIDYIVNRTEP